MKKKFLLRGSAAASLAVFFSGCAILFCPDCKEIELTIKRNERLAVPPTVAVRDVIHKSPFAEIRGDGEHVICMHNICPPGGGMSEDVMWLYFSPDDFSGDVLGIKRLQESAKGAVTDENGYTVLASGAVGSKHFAFDSSSLKGDFAGLIQVVEQMGQCEKCRITVIGHTDAIGSDKYNALLSLRRANAVKSWLVGKGVTSGKISVEGRGKSLPVATNATAEGRAKNRRAEYKVLIKVEAE